MKTEEAFKFIKPNIRYFIVFFVFLFVVFYSLAFLETVVIEEKEVTVEDFQKKIGTEINLEEQGSNKDSFILNTENPKNILENFISSRKGDYYRLVFKVKRNEEDPGHKSEISVGASQTIDANKEEQNQRIKVKLVSEWGEEQEITNVNINEVNGGFAEVVFLTENRFENVVFELISIPANSKEFEGNGEGEIAPTRIKILDGADGAKLSDVRLSRLEINSEKQARNLKPTNFSRIRTSELVARKYYLNRQYNDGLNASNRVIQQFDPSGRYSTQLAMKLNKIGDGGEGEYKIVVRFKDQTIKNTGKSEILDKKIKFFANDLDIIRQEDGFIRFSFLSDFQREGEYSVEITNESVKVDENNYVQLENVTDSTDSASYFKFSFVDFTTNKDSNEEVLGGSTIEDIGSHLIYSYQNNGSIMDFVNIFELDGEIDFDQEDGIIDGKSYIGDFFTYKFDLKNGIEKIKLEVEIFGGNNEEVLIEFSYNNLDWEKINSVDDKNGIQKIDQIISNSNQANKTIYFRVKCNKEEGGVHFGLSSFSIRAKLLK